MTLQTTRVSLIDTVETAFDGLATHIILMEDSVALTDTSTIVDFLSKEPLASDGYSRQPVTLTGWAWSGTNSRVEHTEVTAEFTATGTIQFDALGLLVGSGATANAEIASIASNTLTSNAHGLANGDLVFFTDATVAPTGITLSTLYYVISATTNTFKISATEGGSEITLGTSWTGDLILRYANYRRIFWELRPDDGFGNRTYTINSGQSFTAVFQLGQKIAAA